MFGHKWSDALKDLRGDTFVWPYHSMTSFQQGSRELESSGWVLHSMAEMTRPVGLGRLSLLGPAAFLARPKGIMATFVRSPR